MHLEKFCISGRERYGYLHEMNILVMMCRRYLNIISTRARTYIIDDSYNKKYADLLLN